MRTYDRRLERLEAALPDPGIAAVFRHIAVTDGLTSAELEEFRQDVYGEARAFAGLTLEEGIGRVAAETGEDPQTIRAAVAELEAVYREAWA